MGLLSVRSIEGSLPPDFARLIAAASGESVRNMELLAEGWRSGTQCFDREGAGLFGAFDDERLVGVGGVTPETGYSEPAMRMRRFYVLPIARRSGTGRILALAAMEQGFAHATILTCNARATPLAAPFWEAMGFAPVSFPNITHILRHNPV